MVAVSQILPNFHYGFPGVTELQVLFIIKILTGKQHWVSFFLQWEKSSVGNVKLQMCDCHTKYLIQGIWIFYNIYDALAIFFHSLFVLFYCNYYCKTTLVKRLVLRWTLNTIKFIIIFISCRKQLNVDCRDVFFPSCNYFPCCQQFF